MNQFSAIIFSDSYKEQNNPLVINRTLSSIPFGGRFRMVDFVLSSLVNAGVANVAVVTKRNYASLEDHLGGGRYWDLDHRNSGLRILSPFFRSENNNEVFQARGRLDALRSVKTYVKSIREEYVVLTDANLIANIDFEKIFDTHIDSGADISVVYTKTQPRHATSLVLDVDDTDKIRDITFGGEAGKDANVSMNIYIMKRDLLLDIINKADAHDYYSFEKYALINNLNTLLIKAVEHTGFADIVFSVGDYYNTSMKLLSDDTRSDIFNTDRPIMTRAKDSVPVLYHYNAKVENSLIADGCHIDGTVRNSIIFRNVTIEAGAVIENSIVMQNTVIGAGSTLNCVILDKNTKISANKNLCGAPEYPYVFGKNTEI